MTGGGSGVAGGREGRGERTDIEGMHMGAVERRCEGMWGGVEVVASVQSSERSKEMLGLFSSEGRITGSVRAV